MLEPTTEPVNGPKDMNLNPEGKGGFGEHPEHSNPGGRPKNNESFSYWMNAFKNMPVETFLTWLQDNPDSTRSVASDLAYNRVFAARKDLAEFKEVADRTEGKAKQPIEYKSNLEEEKEQIRNIINNILADENAEPKDD